MKELKSWRERVNSLLAAIMVLVLLFLIWSNGYYNSQIRKSILNENTTTVKVWESFVKKRLDTMYEHVFEILLTVYNNTELAYGTPIMEYMTRKKCLDTMSNKLRINSDADCFFLIDTQSNMNLFSANSSISPSLTAALKSSFRNTALNHTTKLYNRLWNIELIDGEPYFVKSIALGKYVAGTMSRVQRYDISQNLNVHDTSKSCLLISTGDEIFFCSGDPNWAEWLSLDESSRSLTRGSPTAVAMKLSFTSDDSSVILATQNVFNENNVISVIILFVSLTCAALLILLAFNLNHMVVKPTKELLNASREIISGNMNYQITADAGSEEFRVLFGSFNKMTTQIVNLRIESYDRLLREQENKLLLLRAQIKPHFFLNAITTISNMTYQNRLEDIRSYLQSLSKFIRYMLNSDRKWVTVKEEISHINNYLQMQTLRFPGSINAQIDCPDDIGDTHIPILILFTLVENSFKHAMSLYETLELRIYCQHIETDDFSGCRLVVEDNGDGFPDELLQGNSETVNYESIPKDHFGLSNIRYTLQLTYNRFDLLHLSNTPDGGAHVEIWIPHSEVNEQ